MKYSNNTLLAGLGVLTIAATLVSFSTDKGKKRYEIIHHSNGKTITYDTVVPMNSTYTVEAFLADKGIKSENVEIVKIPNRKAKMMFIEKNEKDGEHSAHNVEFKEENVEINVDIDDDGNKTIVKKVNGEVVELTPEEMEEIENNMGEIHVIELEGDHNFEFIGELPEGAEKVEIRAEIDDNGNIVAHKFVNGEEVELTEEELKNLKSNTPGNNQVIELKEGEESGDEQKIIISKTISVEETNDGKEKNRTENHDIQWSSNDKNQEFTIVLVTEDLDESSITSRKTTIQKSNSDLSIYPNPNDGHFTLLLEQSEKAKTNITITDSQGKIVYEENLGKFSGKYAKQIDLKKFGAGTYIITVKQGNNKNVQKVIVQE